jgi:hypothetical protein
MRFIDDDCNTVTPDQFIALCEAKALADADKKVRKAQNALRAVQLLAAEGLNVMLSTWNTDFIEITATGVPDRFRAVHRALGPLEKASMFAEDDEHVIVSLRPKNNDFNMVFVKYKKKLPNGGKCRIVKQTINHHTVICEV